MEGRMEAIDEVVVQGVAVGLALGLLGFLLLLLPLAIPRLVVRRRRNFWCATGGERVDVEFEERGLPRPRPRAREGRDRPGWRLVGDGRPSGDRAARPFGVTAANPPARSRRGERG